MEQYEQINRLIQKGLFDNKTLIRKRQQQKRHRRKVALLTIGILMIAGVFFVRAWTFEAPSVRSSSSAPLPKAAAPPAVSLMSLLSRPPARETNILALGRPGAGYSGANLTDTIIIIHIEPAEQSAALISLPRDFLVEISDGYQTKINSLYAREGIDALKETVTEITGLSIDSYIIIDLAVVKEIIDLIGGLNVYVPGDINDPYFPGPNHSYETFAIRQGWRFLDGAAALRYIRTRYTSPRGDFDRMARQQQVIRLLKQKVLSLNLLWDLPTYLRIFDTLHDHIETDLSLSAIKSLWQIARDVEANRIRHLVIDKAETDLLTGGLIPFGEEMASVVYPQAGLRDYAAIRQYVSRFIND